LFAFLHYTVSGEAPEHPVVSKKSGQVYEHRLIVKYIEDNGKDPVSGEELSVEDLLDIKTGTFYTSTTNRDEREEGIANDLYLRCTKGTKHKHQ
jgi:hypothetical protein